MNLVRCLFAGLVISWCLASAQASEVDSALRGKGLVEEKCAQCHSIGGSDESLHKDAPPFRTLATRWPLEYLEEALAEGIVTGHPDMPTFAFEPEDIDAILEYLHTLIKDDEGAATPEGKS